jgi:next to BRCA1 gene 1 protein
VAREVHSAEEYNRAIAQLRGRFFVDPLLRFSVFDETPHKLPTTMDSFGSMSNLSFKDPFIPGSFPTSPALAAARFPDISASHISPVDIYVSPRHCPLAPMEVDRLPPTSASAPQPQLPALIPSSETPRSAQCHSTADVESLISRFKLDLDEILHRNRPAMRTAIDLQRSEVPLAQNAQESPIATPLCLYKFCMTCSKLFQGPWYKCSKCDVIMVRFHILHA